MSPNSSPRPWRICVRSPVASTRRSCPKAGLGRRCAPSRAERAGPCAAATCLADNRGMPSPPGTADAVPLSRRAPSVVLADDDVLLREGLASLLDRSGFKVAGQAGNSPELLALARAARP